MFNQVTTVTAPSFPVQRQSYLHRARWCPETSFSILSLPHIMGNNIILGLKIHSSHRKIPFETSRNIKHQYCIKSKGLRKFCYISFLYLHTHILIIWLLSFYAELSFNQWIVWDFSSSSTKIIIVRLHYNNSHEACTLDFYLHSSSVNLQLPSR